MPIPAINFIYNHGIGAVPYGWTVVKITAWILAVYFVKNYCGGAINRSERKMHSKVIMITVSSCGLSLNIN